MLGEGLLNRFFNDSKVVTREFAGARAPNTRGFESIPLVFVTSGYDLESSYSRVPGFCFKGVHL